MVIIVALFMFGKTVDQSKSTEMTGPMMNQSQAQGALNAISLDQLLMLADGTLSKSALDSINHFESILSSAKNASEKKQALIQLAEKWNSTGNIIVAGTYYEQLANLNNDPTMWNEAAARFGISYNNVSDSLVRGFSVNHAINAYQQLIKLDSLNQDYKVGLALAYMDGAGNVMAGVSLLKEVEAVDPDNIQMNLTLGRFGIISGQFDKAIIRLQKVISLSKDNDVLAEAWYQLGEAYRATGKKEDAIKSIEKSRDLITNEDFKKQLDIYIQQLKNS